MKFAICNETFQGWTFEAVCQFVAECGYDGLEVAPFTLKDDPRDITEEEARGLAATAKTAGLEILGLHWLLVKPAWLNLTTPDPLLQKDTIAFGAHLARICAAMGGNILVWGSPNQRMVEASWDRVETTARAASVLRAIAEAAGPLGVTIAMEPLARRETNFLNTAAETVELIRQVDHPACRLHLDVKAMSDEVKSIPEIIAESREHIAHFHANDPNLGGPGSGDVVYAPIVEALSRAGYDKWASVEVFDYSPGPEKIARDSLAYLRSVFS